MKLLPGLFAILVLTVPISAKADQIMVRSGEHSDFTRLVFRLPEGTTWELSSETGRTVVVVDGHNQGFDVDGVFSRIPRTRISNIFGEESSLTIQLACDCAVIPFVTEGEYLALDIRSGPPLPDDFWASADVAAQVDLPTSRFRFGDLLWSDDQVDTQPSDEVSPDADRQPKVVEASRHERDVLMEARRSLRDSFAEAATRGVVRLSSEVQGVQSEDMPEVDSSNSETVVFDSSQEPAVSETSLSSNIRITSSLDIPVLERAINPTGAACRNDVDLNMISWGTTDNSFLEVGRLRASLFDSVDSINEATAVKLARLYLYFGFGPEAKQILELSPDVSAKHPELHDIADIMEWGYTRNPRILHTSLDCETPAALWSVLSAKTLPIGEKVAINAVLRALNSLPVHLRQVLAPKVSSRFLAFGNQDAAEKAFRMVQRSPSAVSDSSQLVSAELAISRGETISGTEQLTTLISEGSPMSPSALIDLIETKVDSDSIISPEIALTTEAYAFELSNGEMAKPLLRAHIIASAKSGQFAKAFQELENNWRQNAELAEIDALQSIVVNELSGRADDLTFISTVFSNAEAWSPTMQRDTWLGVARRMLELGFAQEALELTVGKVGADGNAEVQLLLAEIDLHLNNYDDALTRVSTIADSRADNIRAEGQEELGENEIAYIMFSASGENHAARRNARLSDKWNEMVEDDDPIFGPAKQIHDTTLPSTTSNPDMLENFTRLIGESQIARGTIDGLLQNTDIEN